VNVVDLMTLQPKDRHPHGPTDGDFDVLFTEDKPVIFAYHGYPWLIHRLTYRRTTIFLSAAMKKRDQPRRPSI
jgi:xylulose-5-phosphate/fructose-6-phosphate phosphoketolase